MILIYCYYNLDCLLLTRQWCTTHLMFHLFCRREANPIFFPKRSDPPSDTIAFNNRLFTQCLKHFTERPNQQPLSSLQLEKIIPNPSSTGGHLNPQDNIFPSWFGFTYISQDVAQTTKKFTNHGGKFDLENFNDQLPKSEQGGFFPLRGYQVTASQSSQ